MRCECKLRSRIATMVGVALMTATLADWSYAQPSAEILFDTGKNAYERKDYVSALKNLYACAIVDQSLSTAGKNKLQRVIAVCERQIRWAMTGTQKAGSRVKTDPISAAPWPPDLKLPPKRKPSVILIKPANPTVISRVIRPVTLRFSISPAQPRAGQLCKIRVSARSARTAYENADVTLFGTAKPNSRPAQIDQGKTDERGRVEFSYRVPKDASNCQFGISLRHSPSEPTYSAFGYTVPISKR